MSPLVHQSLLFLHLLGAIAWVGGMFFAHFALRPSAAEVLEPPKRLPLIAATLARFFRFVAIAVVALALTGMALFTRAVSPPLGWHVMLILGGVMALVFVYIYAVPFAQLRRHVHAGAWPEAASALRAISRLVAFNLAAGVVVVASAVVARG